MAPKLSAAPPPAPQRPDLDAVPSPQAPKRPKALILVVIAALALGAWLSRPHPRVHTAAPLAAPTAKAVRGVLQSTVRLTGTLEAQRYSALIGPMVQAPDSGNGMTLLYLIDNGTLVKEGDVVARIDPQVVTDHLEDVEANVKQNEMELRGLRASLDAENEVMVQRIRSAKGAWDQAKQDLLALNVRSRIDQEKLKLAVSEAQANYESLQQERPFMEQRHQAQWNIQMFSQNYQIRHRNRHRADLDRFNVKAPIDGQVVIRPIYRNGEAGQVKVGDVLTPGQVFARVADRASLAVEATINQAESELIRIGQRAKVRLDAYPGVVLDGRVEAVGTMAAGGRRTNYYIRRLPVRISIEGSDPLLLPDLTVSADVVTSEEDSGVIVPREAVVETAGKAIVYVRQEDGGFTQREVGIGSHSNTAVTVVSGLQPGEEVSLQPPY